MNKTLAAFQKGFICIKDNNQSNINAAATTQAHLMQFGYMLDKEAFDALSKCDLMDIAKFNNIAMNHLRELTGGGRNYTPLYKNFPEEVMHLSDVDLFLNAICHYWSNGTWEPSTVTYEKPIKFENIKYNIIRNADQNRFDQIFTDLISINTSITPSDMEIVKWFAQSKETLKFPDTIPFKENLCTLAAMGLNVPIKTTTDVLRIAVHMSGGDISLPSVPEKQMGTTMVRGKGYVAVEVDSEKRAKFKFKKFNRTERKQILTMLEKVCDPQEMTLKAQRWIRLGEVIHPGEFKSKFPKSFDAFTKVRNDQITSWYGEVDKAFANSFEEGLKTLSARPGEFMRRIDSLIRNNPGKLLPILNQFDKSAKGVSNKVLFELYTHFQTRAEPQSKPRSIMIKGKRSRKEIPTLELMDKSIVDSVSSKILNTLSNKFANLPKLGNCLVDEELKKIPLPSNMRSMSKAAKPTIRGQRIPFDNPNAKVIRPFVHWMDKNGTEDLDLSVTFVGKTVTVGNFQHLRNSFYTHSGDVRHRQGPCAEYIDVDIQKAIANGIRFVILDVRNFNGRGLNTVESAFGVMEREHPECNPLWVPETISNCHALQSESICTMSAILDLDTKEYIMLDVDSNGRVASSDVNATLSMIAAYTELPKFSVYDLVLLHVQSRGNLVTESDKVDTHFKYTDFVNSYEESAKLMG